MITLHLATTGLLALSSNLDNIGIGISYGIRRVNIPFGSNLMIALITSIGTLISVLLGQTIYLFLSQHTAVLLGGALIIAAGIWVVIQEKFLSKNDDLQDNASQQTEPLIEPSKLSFRNLLEILNNPIIADRDFSGHIDLKESVALALGLTINNIPNGIGAGMLGLNLPIMTSAVFFTSIITIWVGTSTGHLGFRRLGNSAGLISGLMLILIGVYELIS